MQLPRIAFGAACRRIGDRRLYFEPAALRGLRTFGAAFELPVEWRTAFLRALTSPQRKWPAIAPNFFQPL